MPVKAINLCLKHYQRQYHRKTLADCIFDECGKPQKAKGYCDTHYTRLRLHGDPSIVKRPTWNLTPDEIMSKQPEYSSWCNMKSRCLNPNDPRYDRYGGRGITVCQRWLDSFWNYLEDVGRKPSPKHTIDRINNDGNYEPGNVRWATTREQNKNRSNSRPISGVGSYTDKGTIRWYASLRIGKTWMLHKTFKTMEEAIEARKEAERIYLPDVI